MLGPETYFCFKVRELIVVNGDGRNAQRRKFCVFISKSFYEFKSHNVWKSFSSVEENIH